MTHFQQQQPKLELFSSRVESRGRKSNHWRFEEFSVQMNPVFSAKFRSHCVYPIGTLNFAPRLPHTQRTEPEKHFLLSDYLFKLFKPNSAPLVQLVYRPPASQVKLRQQQQVVCRFDLNRIESNRWERQDWFAWFAQTAAAATTWTSSSSLDADENWFCWKLSNSKRQTMVKQKISYGQQR